MKRRLFTVANACLNSILGSIALFCISLSPSSMKAEDGEYQFYGRHLVVSFKDCSPEALSNIDGLKDAFIRAVNACGATCLSTADFVFEPNGLTMVALLSESHASIHTYPEFRSCFVDLFTCGTKCSNEAFKSVLIDYLKPEIIDDVYLERK